MRKFYSKFLASMVALLIGYFSYGQVSVTASAGTTGPTAYTTLKAAFDAINAGTHQGSVTVNINGNTTETATAVINASTGAASYTDITVNGTGAFTVSANMASPLIRLNGATNVTIDGNNTLVLTNTNAAGNVISFIGDASNNTVKETTIRGATNVNVSGFPTLGLVTFGTGVTTGNDGNTIDDCDIDGNGAATCGVYSKGSATSSDIQNSGNTIKNSRIHDNIFAAASGTIALLLDEGNTGWTIENNSIYHSNPVSLSNQIVVRGILIVPDFTTDAHTVTGNFVGGNAPNAAGTMSISGTGSLAAGFIGIDVETGGPNNLVQGNTVKNVTLTYAASAGSFGNAGIFGFIGGFNGTSTFNNNTVSDITVTNNNGFIAFQAIHFNTRVTASGFIAPEVTVTNNTVNNITANSGGAGDYAIYGLRLETSSGATLTNTALANTHFVVSGNTVTNISSTFNGSTSSFIRGIGTVVTQGTNSTAGLVPHFEIISNNVNGLSAASLGGSSPAVGAFYASPSVIGIHFAGSSAIANTVDWQIISKNNVHNINATNTGDVNSVAMGILANNVKGRITENKVYDIKNSAAGNANNPGVVGVSVRFAVDTVEVINNFVSVGSGSTGNVNVFGIVNNSDAPGPIHVYHNSVAVAGAGAAGNTKVSAAFARASELLAVISTPVDIKNNIFHNQRTGGTANFAIANTGTTAPLNWVSDFNNLYSNSAATIGFWGATPVTLAGLQTASSADVNSSSVAAVFVDIAAGDLHLTGASIGDANLEGTPSDVTIDIDNETRSTTAPIMGADEVFAVCVAPAITTQPAAVSGCEGSTATMTVVATGTGLSYQWRKGTTDIAGATSATLTINNLTAADAGADYNVVITNACGTVTSADAAITVNAAPAITTQPAAQTACVGGSASFTVAATGTGLTYQWRRNGTDITGETGATLTINPVTAGNAGSYTVVVTGGGCSVTSNAVNLTVNAATTITTQPTAVTTCLQQNATFTVVAAGAAPLSYQWRKDGADIAGATSASYTVSNVTSASAGSYTVVVTGACGNVTSNPATLTVSGPCTSIPTVDADITKVVLMPNVVNDVTTLRVNATRSMRISWNVVDMNGKVVMSFDNQVTAGQNDILVRVAQLGAGTYQVVGNTTKGRTEVVRFIKH